MHLYNAGFVINVDIAGRLFGLCNEAEQAHRLDNPYYLESYHYVGKPTMLKRVRREKENYFERTGKEVVFFLDSGAFSAYSLGATIDIGRYCDYCLQNADVFNYASVLDVIDFNDSARSIKGTYQNLLEMERRGVKALPCFHYGEPEEVLEHYVANYEYITLGGMVPISTKQLMIWLDRIWPKYMCNPDGTPKIKVHGFGLTSLPLMMRYPWYSVDSSTWVQWGSNGMILIPRSGKQINISARSGSRKMQDQHFETVVPQQRDIIAAEIESFGGDTQRLADLYFTRWVWNSWAFPKYVELRGGGAHKFVRDYIGVFDE